MLLTINAKLQPTEEQRQKLLNTMKTFNAACDDISRDAYESKTRAHHYSVFSLNTVSPYMKLLII
jgi:predicted transposase